MKDPPIRNQHEIGQIRNDFSRGCATGYLFSYQTVWGRDIFFIVKDRPARDDQGLFLTLAINGVVAGALLALLLILHRRPFFRWVYRPGYGRVLEKC